MWAYVRQRFGRLNRNLLITEDQRDDCVTKVKGVTSALNRAFWEVSEVPDSSFVVGSWGKRTVVRPPSDVDVFYLPPVSLFDEYNRKQGNVQSQLLQRFRGILLNTYPQTQIRGDGQVVVVQFNSLTVEVVPAFRINGGGYYICDTNDGGRWKAVDADVELIAMNVADDESRGNCRKLVRIMKQWARHCNAPIKGFHIEQLVKEFLGQYEDALRDEFWFDWFVLDFLRYLLSRRNGSFLMPGSHYERIELGEAWYLRAQAAYETALKACDYERHNMEVSAGLEWEKLFGNMVPTWIG